LYFNLEISESLKKEDNSFHFRLDNGAEKVGYSSKRSVLASLYRLIQIYPKEIFQAYVCDFCGKYHIGKTTLEDNQDGQSI
jgi:hypothetical protein